MIKLLKKKLYRLIWAYRYKKAVKKANEFHKLFGMTYFVILMGGRLKVVPKKTLKTLWAKKRFRKGTSWEEIEKCALYVAD